MNAFSTAIDTIFADPNMAVEALWLEAGIPPGVPVKAIRRMPDAVTDYGTARLVQPSVVVDVRVSEVATAKKDDRLVIGGEFYIVQAAPTRDVLGLVWTLDLRAA